MRAGKPMMLAALTAAVAGVAPASAIAQTRLPSEVLHDVARGRLENPAWSPNEIEQALKPLLTGVRTTDLEPGEEVALALAYFFTFDGPSARPLFEKHIGRDDMLGRVSWQSLQQMSFVGARDYPLVERRLKEFREKFRPVLEDGEYTYNMVNNLARLRAGSGDHAGAVALIVEDLESLPLDVPLRSFDLPAVHYASFVAVRKQDVALDWLTRHRDALRTANGSAPPESAAAAPPSGGPRRGIPAEALQIPHRPGVLHLMPFTDLLFQDRDNWSVGESVRYRRNLALGRFDRWIAAVERGDAPAVR